MLRPEHERLSDVLRETEGQIFRDEEFAAHLQRVAATEDNLPRDQPAQRCRRLTASWHGRYCVPVASTIDFTIAFDGPDADGWIVARVLEVPGALSQGRTREQARENVLDALRTVLAPDDELSGRPSGEDLEHLRFVAAA